VSSKFSFADTEIDLLSEDSTVIGTESSDMDTLTGATFSIDICTDNYDIVMSSFTVNVP